MVARWIISCSLLLTGLLVTPPPSEASAGAIADLKKLERTPPKEPHYKSQPKYCLLVFGQSAQRKIWLVLDGETLYVDRDGSGNLTSPDDAVRPEKPEGSERVFRTTLTASKDSDKPIQLSVERYNDLTLIRAELDATHRQVAGTDASGNLQFADSPKDAPVVHFDGPLTMRTNGDALVRGRGAELYVLVGTPGIGAGTFAALLYECVPAAAQPVAEISFPQGTQRIVLKERC